MRVACHLRQIRGTRTLAEISASSGVAQPALSMIERGFELPRDEWIPKLVEAYGCEPTAWWPPAVLLALSGDEA